MGFSLSEVEAAGGYSVIYADPPWSYSDKGCNGAAAKQYPTLSVAEVCALPVERLAARDAVLFLWATYPNLPAALKVIEAWGFTFKSIGFQWVKTYPKSDQPFFGLGRWTRGNTEPCLLATRGKPKRIASDVGQLLFSEDEVLFAPVTRHSAKPPEARGKIERLLGDVPRIELFAREKVAGWDAWGNEIASDVDLSGNPNGFVVP